MGDMELCSSLHRHLRRVVIVDIIVADQLSNEKRMMQKSLVSRGKRKMDRNLRRRELQFIRRSRDLLIAVELKMVTLRRKDKSDRSKKKQRKDKMNKGKILYTPGGSLSNSAYMLVNRVAGPTEFQTPPRISRLQRISSSFNPILCFFFASSSIFSFHRYWHRNTDESLSL
ncbi:hypothetical protein [Absidia glauca]|uniref:Uncharacterized protein n=1 Tax=Absidia glauca TaxID=4829 RepID=A0A163MEI0_ABSGL|nr:hypothetical protein [Absidia glauca]